MYDRISAGTPSSFTICMRKTQKTLVYIDNAELTSNALAFDSARYSSVYLKRDTPFTPGKYKARPVDQRYANVEVTGDSPLTQYPTVNWYKFYLTGDITPYFVCMSPWNLFLQGSVVSLPASILDDTKRQLCIMGSAAKVAAPNVDAPVFLAEIGDTLKLLRKPLTLLDGNWKKFSKIPRAIQKNYRKTHKYLSDKWLEYRYGIMPLVYDAEGIMEAVQALKTKFGTQLRYTSEAMLENKSQVSTVSQTWSDNTYGGCWRGCTTRTWYEFGVVGRTYYNYNWDYVNRPSEVLGFDIRRLPEVAWELTPYSFVLDWFINVGPWLAAHRSKPGVEILGHTSSVKTIRYDQTKLDYLSFLPISTYWSSRMLPTGSYTKKTESYSRVVSEKLPSLPTVNWDLTNLNHVVDSLALILTNIKRT